MRPSCSSANMWNAMRTSWDVGVGLGGNIQVSSNHTHAIFHRIVNIKCRGTHYAYAYKLRRQHSSPLQHTAAKYMARCPDFLKTETILA